MSEKILKQSLCIILTLLQFGCHRTYRLDLRTIPTGATVQAGSKVYGVTPCVVKISRNSRMIKDSRIDITYAFPDGQIFVKNYDLRHYKPASDFPSIIGGIVAAPGILLIGLTVTDKDDSHTSFDEDDDYKNRLQWQLIGAGFIGAGILTYWILGGDAQAGDGYEITETEQNLWLKTQ